MSRSETGGGRAVLTSHNPSGKLKPPVESLCLPQESPVGCRARHCTSPAVLVSDDLPLCEPHLIQAYREMSQWLQTRRALEQRTNPAHYRLVGQPFGNCPQCDLALLVRHDELGDVKCVNDGCEFACTAAEFCDMCDRIVERMAEAQKAEVVYYLRFGDRVKIGTTTNLQQRLIAIPHDEVLATEPGGPYVERQRHQQFKHLQVRGGRYREWFAITPELVDHIASVKARQAA